MDEVAVFLCEFCFNPVDPLAPDTLHSVKGWEKPRKQGGTNTIHLRQETGKFAHDECVNARKVRRR
jgi:hypothetical protein